MNEQNPLRLNLGCGLQCPQGWVNIDSSFGAKLARRPVLNKILRAFIPASWGLLPNSQWASNVTWMDITRRFPYADNSVDAVYSSHTLEHLTWEEGSMVFKECYRVMKPGGVIRIIVPDLYVIIQHYMEAKSTKPEMAARKFLHDTYFFEIPIPKTLTGMIKFYFKRKTITTSCTMRMRSGTSWKWPALKTSLLKHGVRALLRTLIKLISLIVSGTLFAWRVASKNHSPKLLSLHAT